MKSLKELKIGDLIAKIPIIQGGMGVGISLSGLASSVANEGGIGVISVAGIGMREPDFFKNFVGANIRALKDEIHKARTLSQGVLGVNIMVALTNFADMVKTAIEEKIDIIFAGAGLPLSLPKFLTPGSKTKLVPIVSSGKAARIISERWYKQYNYLPDAIVVEGPMAGGHLGFKAENIDNPAYSLEILVPDVVTEMQKFEEKYNKSIPLLLRAVSIPEKILINSSSWVRPVFKWQHVSLLPMNAMRPLNSNKLMLMRVKTMS